MEACFLTGPQSLLLLLSLQSSHFGPERIMRNCAWAAITADVNSTLVWTAYDNFAWVLNGHLTVILSLLGIGGNLWSIFHIWKEFRAHRNIAMHLMSWTGWDMLLLLSTTFYYGISSLLVDFSSPIFRYDLQKSVNFLFFCLF